MNIYIPDRRGGFFEPEDTCNTEFGGDVISLNDLHEALTVVRFGGKTRIVTWTDSEARPGTKVPAFFDIAAMSAYYANRFVLIPDGQGNLKLKPLFQEWMKHPKAPRADGITLAASEERFVNGALNLWTGFAVQPKLGAWPLLRKHIEEVICSKDEESRYLLKWCAWTLQNPVSPSEVAIVMRGGKGAGKGVFGNLLTRIFGAHGLQISNPKHLVGHFNSHLMHTCLLFADEALWAGDKASEGVLKRTITERTLTIEPKGVDSFEAPNRLSIIMASNEDWVVPASLDERRFAVFNVSNGRQGDRGYFGALHRELYEAGGAEAFVHDMLAMPLGDWHPRFEVPQTAGLREQQIESAAPEIHWLWCLLEDGKLGSFGGDSAKLAGLLEKAQKSSPGLRYMTAVKLAKLLKTVGAKKKRNEYGSYWLFPPLEEARVKFMEAYPGFEPFTENSEGIQWDNIPEDEDD